MMVCDDCDYIAYIQGECVCKHPEFFTPDAVQFWPVISDCCDVPSWCPENKELIL